MKVANLIGSPRFRGNTSYFVNKATEGAREMGAEVVDIYLFKKKMRPCVDCNRCETDGICKVKDDFQEALEIVKDSDAIILSTPVYFGSVTGHMKIWIDRCNSLLYTPGTLPLAEKPTAIIITCGYPFSYPIPNFDRQINRSIKLVSGDTLRCAINKTRVFDMTIDTLRELYVYCIYMDMEVIGTLEVMGLEHATNIAPTRTEELEQAYQLGKRLVASIKSEQSLNSEQVLMASAQ